MKSKHRLHKEDDEKAGIRYLNFPAFQGLYFLIVLHAFPMRMNIQTKISTNYRGKEYFPFSQNLCGLCNHAVC